MKIMLCGTMPKVVNEGGNIFWDDDIQMMVPLFCFSEDRMPQTNAEEAEKDSFVGQMNSCMHPSGNW